MINPKKIVEYLFPKFYVKLVKYKNCIKFSKVKTKLHEFEGLHKIRLKKYTNTFFGYYDKSSFNPQNDNFLIFHANNRNPLKVPSAKKATDIILYDLNKKDYRIIGKTYCWNWQQGARLHWIDEDNIVYNWFDKEELKYKCIKKNISDNSEIAFPFPVQDSFKNDFFISINYVTLNKTRPDYGYRNIKKENNNKNNAVYKVSFTTGVSEKLFTINDIKDLLKIKNNNYIKRSRINHIMINPNGGKFIFLFRYYYKYSLKHVLLAYNFRNKQLHILINNEMISHYCWLDNDNIIFWGIIKNKSDYFQFNTETQKMQCLSTNLPDGHPSVLNDHTIVTDTYPDNKRNRRLLLVDIKENNIKELLTSFEPCKFVGETRCDLHPHPHKNRIHFDSIENGVRELSILELDS